jgi:mono/diheme cytochrome c family protein
VIALLLSTIFALSAHAAPVAFYPRQFADFEKALGGTIPFPPEKLARQLTSLDPGSSLITSIFPHGRSLERAVTDFHSPRSVLAWQSNSPSAPYFLYLGYTPAAEQLEVISWNWSERRFDFSFVTDYAPGKTPHVQHAYRPLCIACHQNGGPLFPGGPWNETTQNIDVLKKLQSDARDSLSQFLLNLPLDSAEPIRLGSSTTDGQIRSGTALMQIQNVCRDGCGGDLECRKGLLLASLRETMSRGDSEFLGDGWRNTMRAAMQKAWPEHGFAVLDGVIQDRDFDFAKPFAFSKDEDPLRWRALELGHSATEGMYSNMMERYAQCWSFDKDQLELLRAWGAARLDAAMHTEQASKLVSGWLPNESEILSALGEAIKNPKPIGGDRNVAWATSSEPRIIAYKSAKDPGGLFLEYCAGCHMNSNNRPPNLPLANLAELRSYVGSADRTVKDLIGTDHPLMPPPGAPQPSREERAQMLSIVR